MLTDTSEKGLETLIVESLIHEAGYLLGRNEDYDWDHAVDLTHLLAFLKDTQPRVVESLGIETDGPSRQQFLHRLQGEIAKRGVRDRRHGPPALGQADSRYYQAVHAGRGRGWGCDARLGTIAPVHRVGQEDHHFDRAEDPVYPG
jgi:hypothetical protein